MTNFDFYRNNPTAAANLIAREGNCWYCPMYERCEPAPTHDYGKCPEMWKRFFKFNTETLESVDDFSELLSLMIDCDKCTVEKLNECDCIDKHNCGLTISNWLCKRFTFCPEPR